MPCSLHSVLDGFASALSEQHPEAHDADPTAQQSHLQSSQAQTPDSQQHPPSGQQLVHEQAAELLFAVLEFEKLAPSAKPTPTNNNRPSAAANFILLSFENRTLVCLDSPSVCLLDAQMVAFLHAFSSLFSAKHLLESQEMRLKPVV